MAFSETLQINRYKGIPDLAKTHQKAFISPVDRGKSPNHIPVGKLVWTKQGNEDRFIQPIIQSPTKKKQAHGISILDQGSGHSFHAYLWSGSEKFNGATLIKFETILLIKTILVVWKLWIWYINTLIFQMLNANPQKTMSDSCGLTDFVHLGYQGSTGGPAMTTRHLGESPRNPPIGEVLL